MDNSYTKKKEWVLNVLKLNILHVYNVLPTEMQARIFEPPSLGTRKVVGYIHKDRSHKNYNHCFVFHVFLSKNINIAHFFGTCV
jgi:hypothetical protein